MGYRSTFVTSAFLLEAEWKLPGWFREKYAGHVNFDGCLSSTHGGKFYEGGAYVTLVQDLRTALDEGYFENESNPVFLVQVGEDGAVWRYTYTRGGLSTDKLAEEYDS